ncbi:hypothetical protein ACF058_26990 [Streptomyces sp. NPDC015501]|uniref:hypothetical protein n=1 Tax=unclassified Streptomyces TaxID=2593676 RepID=UPI0011A3785F|nr:hypothetical protein A3L22_28015 [Streptomyces griseus subsp. griseus]
MGVPEFNRIGAELIDCSVPNLGVENAPPPVRDVDVTGDGDPDVIVSFACVTGNSSSFSHVVAFDGRSPADAPRTVAILLHMPESKDYRQAVKEGARVRKITGHGDSLTLVADKWRPGDATACPSLTFVQIFTVDRKGLSAKEPTELDVNACTG